MGYINLHLTCDTQRELLNTVHPFCRHLDTIRVYDVRRKFCFYYSNTLLIDSFFLHFLPQRGMSVWLVSVSALKRSDVPKRRRGPDAPRPPYYLALSHGHLQSVRRGATWRLRIVPANYRLRYICQRRRASVTSDVAPLVLSIIAFPLQQRFLKFRLFSIIRKSYNVTRVGIL